MLPKTKHYFDLINGRDIKPSYRASQYKTNQTEKIKEWVNYKEIKTKYRPRGVGFQIFSLIALIQLNVYVFLDLEIRFGPIKIRYNSSFIL